MGTKDLHIAYFQTVDNNKDIAKTIVAFSNTSGGVLYIGKNSNGKVIGVFPTLELERLSNILSLHTIGTLNFKINQLEEKSKLFIELIISESEEKGVKFVDVGSKEKSTYIFDGEKSILAPHLQVLAWKFQSINSIVPERIAKDENDLLKLIKENPGITITQAQKKSNLTIAQFEYNVVRLINWKLVCVKTSNNGSFLEVL